MAKEREHIIYQIRIRGELDPTWADYFEGLCITHGAEGDTYLTGPIIDHTALHSILLKIRDLNLKLVSVNRIAADASDV